MKCQKIHVKDYTTKAISDFNKKVEDGITYFATVNKISLSDLIRNSHLEYRNASLPGERNSRIFKYCNVAIFGAYLTVSEKECSIDIEVNSWLLP